MAPEDTPFPQVSYDLTNPVQIVLDDVGMPHIYASTTADAVWAQGYMVMRDRMFQMDINRRIAGGRSAELLGEYYYQVDLLYRSLNFRDLCHMIYEDLQLTNPEVTEILEAYAAGANAYLDDAIAGRNGATLSDQVKAVGYIPEPWHPVDSLMIDKLLTFNLSTSIEIDLAVSLVGQAIGDQVAMDLIRVQPSESTVIVPGFYGERQPPGPNGKVARLEGWEKLTDAQRRSFLKSLNKMREVGGRYEGSNNWVVGPEYTESGSPLLANDTHQGVDAPATYYTAHLSTVQAGGDLSVSGYNFPGFPLVAFGHNSYAAWAVTNNFADVNEIYQETIRNGKAVIGGQQIPLDTRTEVIRVRADGGTVANAEPRQVEMSVVPPHGPVLPPEVVGDVPFTFSLAWSGFRNIESITLLSMLANAHNYSEFSQALDTFHVGAQNFLFANMDGDIGYMAHTDIPVRANLSPECAPIGIVSGTGDCEWTGNYVPYEQIPQVKNPASGYIVTANNDPSGNVQDDDVFNDPYYLSSVYDNGLRAFRIDQLIRKAIEDKGFVTPEDFQEIQGDNLSQLARRLVPYLKVAAANRPDLLTTDTSAVMDIFEAWDYRTGTDSAAALAFHCWLPYVLRDVFADETFDALFDDLTHDYVNMLGRPLLFFLDKTADTIDEIEAGSAGFPSASGLNYFDNQNTEVLETRDEVLLTSLKEAVGEMLATRGPLNSWRWGTAHTITFNDRAEVFLPSSTKGPYEEDGGLFTVDPAEFSVTVGGSVPSVFDTTSGPSQRTIYSVVPDDMMVWDILPGGQSERPSSPFFMDQAQRYLDNQYRARPFYSADVQAEKTSVIDLGTDGVPTNGRSTSR